MIYKLEDNPLYWVSQTDDDPDLKSVLAHAQALTPQHILKQETYGLGPWIVYLCLAMLSRKYPDHFSEIAREFYSNVVAPTRAFVLKHPHCLKGMPALAHIIGEGSTFLNEWVETISKGMTKTEFGRVYMGPVMWKKEIIDIDLSLSHGNLAFLNLAKNLLKNESNSTLSQLLAETEDFYRNFSLSKESQVEDRLFHQRGILSMRGAGESFSIVQLISLVQSQNISEANAVSQKILKRLNSMNMTSGLHFGSGFFATLFHWAANRANNLDLNNHASRLLQEAETASDLNRENLNQILAFSERPEAIELVRQSFGQECSWNWTFAFGIFRTPEELELFR